MRVLRSDEFARWMRKLRDGQARMRINHYFERVQRGSELTGDFKVVRPKIIEVRFDFGPGYRVYLTQESGEIVILLIGGDKSTQDRDIDKAEEIAKAWRESRGNGISRV